MKIINFDFLTFDEITKKRMQVVIFLPKGIHWNLKPSFYKICESSFRCFLEGGTLYNEIFKTNFSWYESNSYHDFYLDKDRFAIINENFIAYKTQNEFIPPYKDISSVAKHFSRELELFFIFQDDFFNEIGISNLLNLIQGYYISKITLLVDKKIFDKIKKEPPKIWKIEDISLETAFVIDSYSFQ